MKILTIKKEKIKKRRRITKDPKTNNSNKQNKNKTKNKIKIKKCRDKWMKKNKNQRAKEIL